MTGDLPPLHACTIVSKNYLSYARVLARSFLDHHPGGRFFVLLVDRIDGYFDAAAEPFELIEVEALENIADVKALLFKYTVLEANTAVKPFFLEQLFASEGPQRLIYLDPDILVVRPLDHLRDVLEQNTIALTPHLTAPIEDTAFPDELAILRSGTYNLGFIGLAKSDPVDRFLGWWQKRVFDRCVVRVEEGLFVDQKWVDLVPGFYPDVGIIHHPGYNVAYWNLHCRRVEMGEMLGRSDGLCVNGEPLAFFHFSGLQPDLPEVVSLHQNRFTLDDLGDLRHLFERYIALLREAGLEETRNWPYAFAGFDNGVAVPDLTRAQYLSLGEGHRQFGDPFATAGEGSYWRWMNGPARRRSPPYLSRLLFYLWETQRELQSAYPDPHGADLDRLAEWINVYGKQTYQLPEETLTALAPLLQSANLLAAARQTTKRAIKRTYESPPARVVKEWIKRHLGADRIRAIKRIVTPLSVGHPSASAIAGPYAQKTDLSRAGINVIGYIRTESGMGEGARSIVRAAETIGLSHSVSNISFNVVSRMKDRTVGDQPNAPDYGINLFVVNADQVPAVAQHIGHSRFRAHYNVGVWVWEQDHFPSAWFSAFDYFDEIWTPSRFAVDALSTVSPIPVRRMPHLVDVITNPDASRQAFGVPPERFVFLFVFDYLSYSARKNPLGTVQAFTRAFTADEPVTLILKCANSDFDPETHAALQREAANRPQIQMIDRYLQREEVIDLMAVSDAYVSLHRSEGFGLTLAEAMCLGKPVVATHYSGNTDFMNPANSLPVGYQLITLEQDAGPYLRGTHWAEPDLEQAAHQMRRVYEDRDLGRQLGNQAASDITSQFGRQAVGQILRDRVGDILRREASGGLTHPAG